MYKPKNLGPSSTLASTRFIKHQLRKLQTPEQLRYFNAIIKDRTLTRVNVFEAVDLAIRMTTIGECCIRCTERDRELKLA